MARRRRSTKKLLCVCICLFAGFVYSRLLSHVVSSASSSAQSSTGPSINTPATFQKPPLEKYVQGWNITGDVSWLLDFSIVGFPKTGTSSLMLYLEQQADSVFIFEDERCELGWNQHVKLLRDLYKHYQPHRRMGIKCPRDLEIDLSLGNYHQFFPTTKFIVGLRHPILWFQSFYNFRVTNEFEMPPAEKLIGKCKRWNQGVCTFRANFSRHLEQIEPERDVFLYHVDQLQRTDAERSKQFLSDLGMFLDVQRPLKDPMIWVKPGQRDMSASKALEINAKKINICDDRYSKLRQVLLDQAANSATWIKEVFLLQPNVKVSSSDYFLDRLEAWYHDPCEKPGGS